MFVSLCLASSNQRGACQASTSSTRALPLRYAASVMLTDLNNAGMGGLDTQLLPAVDRSPSCSWHFSRTSTFGADVLMRVMIRLDLNEEDRRHQEAAY